MTEGEGVSEAIETAKHIDTLLDQIEHLRAAVDNTIDLGNMKARSATNQGLFITFICSCSCLKKFLKFIFHYSFKG